MLVLAKSHFFLEYFHYLEVKDFSRLFLQGIIYCQKKMALRNTQNNIEHFEKIKDEIQEKENKRKENALN